MVRDIRYGLASTIPDGSITNAKLADNTITNQKINAAAGIVYSKLSLSNGITDTDIASTMTLSKILDKSLTNQSVTGNTTETNIVSYVMPANTLQLSKVIRVTLFVDTAAITGGFSTSIRFKLAGTTLATITLNPNANTTYGGKLEFYITNNGATNIQEATVMSNLMQDAYVGNGNLQPMYGASSRTGTGAVDTTVAQTVSITVQHALSTSTFTTLGHIIDIIG